MERIATLQAARAVEKARFEQCWRNGDAEGEALCVVLIESIDKAIRHELSEHERADL